MGEDRKSVFRNKTLERISSPEQLTEYLRVTNPGIWMVLSAVILLFIGVFAWACIGTLETRADAKIIVSDDTATIIMVDPVEIKAGMTVNVASQQFVIASVQEDEYGRNTGIAVVMLPDGTYDGTVVTESVHAIDFLIKNG